MRIALTIDTEHPDRPCDPENPELMVEILKAEGVKATFFVQGAWALSHPHLLRRIRDDGHLIGNHSHWHAPMTKLREPGAKESVTKAEAAIVAVCGVDPRPWFRLPYGDGAGPRHPGMTELLDNLGYRHVGWDVDPRDWDPEATPASILECVKDVIASKADPVKIVLHAWPDATLFALPRLIEKLRLLGDFVRLDEA